MSLVGKEPVIIQLLAGAIAYLAAKYVPGLDLSDAQAFGAAATIWVLLAPFVRQLVTPTAKVDASTASTGNTAAGAAVTVTYPGGQPRPAISSSTLPPPNRPAE